MDRDDIEYWNDVVRQLDSVFRMLLPMNESDKGMDFGTAAGILVAISCDWPLIH